MDLERSRDIVILVLGHVRTPVSLLADFTSYTRHGLSFIIPTYMESMWMDIFLAISVTDIVNAYGIRHGTLG